jgi:hypothetical protein
LLAEEFPDDPVDAVWIAADGAGLVARSGQTALVLWRKGDGYVARDLPWTARRWRQPTKGGRLRLALADAPPARVNGEVWPPPNSLADGPLKTFDPVQMAIPFFVLAVILEIVLAGWARRTRATRPGTPPPRW